MATVSQGKEALDLVRYIVYNLIRSKMNHVTDFARLPMARP
jgi:hypothetical protein